MTLQEHLIWLAVIVAALALFLLMLAASYTPGKKLMSPKMREIINESPKEFSAALDKAAREGEASFIHRGEVLIVRCRYSSATLKS